jgi:uncharacterized membrane protein YgcG
MRKRVIILATMAALAAGSALAQGTADDLVRQLRAQGYSQVTVERTWLGRIRILARNADSTREIILNPRTGEILRDYWVAIGDTGGSGGSLLGSGSGGSSGSGGGSGSGSGSDDDDDDTDDVDDSGSGSGSDDSDDDSDDDG